jgi:drug/metabolite transporter (DMT)-like permease
MTCLFISIRSLPTSISFMIFNMNPVFVAVLAYLLLKEKITPLNVLCVIGAFTGVVLVAYGRKDEKEQGEYQIVAI